MKFLDVDVVVVGSGVQALLTWEQLSRTHSHLRTVLVSEPDACASQTLSSQCYLHGGHFYRSPSLVSQLVACRGLWNDLLQAYAIPAVEQQSYMALPKAKNGQEWLKRWQAFGLDYEIADPPGHIGTRADLLFVRVDAPWIDGAMLLDRLFLAAADHVIEGSVVWSSALEGPSYRLMLDTPDGFISLTTNKLILAAGLGNQPLVDQILPRNRLTLQQNRRCQVLVLEGAVPPCSILFPVEGLFIVPTMIEGRTTWLCTYGQDDVVVGNPLVPPPLDQERLASQIATTSDLFPGLLERSDVRLGIYTCWKAESKELGAGKRPDEAYVREVNPNLIVIWPTKLTLAPLAARAAAEHLGKHRYQEGQLRPLEMPKVSHTATMPHRHRAARVPLQNYGDFLKLHCA